MEKIVKLVRHGHQNGELDQVIMLDGITHFGRSYDVIDRKVRDTPSDIKDAKIAVYIDAPSVSRNHAIIYPPYNGTPGMLEDLNSLNGTHINGRRIAPGFKNHLSAGDTISFESVSLDYFPLNAPPESSVFTACGEASHGVNYGLMVGCDGGNLKGVINDVKKLSHILEERGFEGNIHQLLNGDATKSNILANLAKFRALTTDHSIFLFYFSGHGDYFGGLGLDGFIIPGRLGPTKLLDELSDFRGQKLLILDGCYTSAFARDNLPPRTVVIGTEGKAYEDYAQSMLKPGSEGVFQDEPNIMGLCTRALYKSLKDNTGRVNVEYLVDQIKADRRIKIHNQNICFSGQTQIFI